MSLKHENSGKCLKCEEIFKKYPGFHAGLWFWFRRIQSDHKDAHISCAGRGQVEQEACFSRGTSKARYGESAHNYNMAVDIFQLRDGIAVWNQTWFNEVLKNLPLEFEWYGKPGSRFFELPHVEVKGWKLRADKHLVEPISETNLVG